MGRARKILSIDVQTSGKYLISLGFFADMLPAASLRKITAISWWELPCYRLIYQCKALKCLQRPNTTPFALDFLPNVGLLTGILSFRSVVNAINPAHKNSHQASLPCNSDPSFHRIL